MFYFFIFGNRIWTHVLDFPLPLFLNSWYWNKFLFLFFLFSFYFFLILHFNPSSWINIFVITNIFEDWFGIGIHYDFQYVFLKGFNMYHSLWILSRFLLNLKLLDIILILIIGRTLSPYFTEIIIYKVSLLWSKERIPTPSLQAKMHHAHASCEARFRLLTYSLLILQLF